MSEPSVAISGIGVCVSDLEASRRFYVEGLGCQPVGEPLSFDIADSDRLGVAPGGLAMTQLSTDGGFLLKLVQRPGAAAEARPRSAITDPAGPSYISFVVEDVAATRDRLVGMGATALSDAAIERGLAFVTDPDGNLVELLRKRTPRP